MLKFFIYSNADYCTNDNIESQIQKIYQKNIVNEVKKANFILCIGGDGTMLRAIHKYHKLKLPFYGINRGNVGFLLNELQNINLLLESVNNSKKLRSYFLEGELINTRNKKKKIFAINEISFLRSVSSASHLSLSIDNKQPKINKLIADGILVSSPIGSTAYNRACKGAIILPDSQLMSITPINPFSPINWNGAVVSDKSTIYIENLDIKNRKINCSNDYVTSYDIKYATITTSNKSYVDILFDYNNNILKKTLREQFTLIH